MANIFEQVGHPYFTVSIEHLIGRRYMDEHGQVWQLDSHNDLRWPYWVKVKNGKPQHTRYNLANGAEIVEDWLKETEGTFRAMGSVGNITSK